MGTEQLVDVKIVQGWWFAMAVELQVGSKATLLQVELSSGRNWCEVNYSPLLLLLLLLLLLEQPATRKCITHLHFSYPSSLSIQPLF